MSINVLLVEDMRQVRAVVADLLASLGDFRVVGEVATEAEAKLWLEQHPGGWDLAIVDLILEQGTGMGVVSKCREQAARGKVVVFSDYATPGIRKHCLQLGADEVFQKNVDVQAFIGWCSALAEGQAPGARAAPAAAPAPTASPM